MEALGGLVEAVVAAAAAAEEDKGRRGRGLEGGGGGGGDDAVLMLRQPQDSARAGVEVAARVFEEQAAPAPRMSCLRSMAMCCLCG